MTGMRINVLPMAGVSFNFQSTDGGRVMDTSPIKVLYRRVDLAGEGQPETLRMTNGGGSLIQGRWQLMLAPSSAYVATDFYGCRGERPEGSRADGWNETTVTGPCGIHLVLSNKPGGVNGTVTMGANEPAGGVPVFLEAYDEVTHKRVVDLHSTRTDMRGKYHFAGLRSGHVPPCGHVRIPHADHRRYRCDASARLQGRRGAGPAAGSGCLGDPIVAARTVLQSLSNDNSRRIRASGVE